MIRELTVIFVLISIGIPLVYIIILLIYSSIKWNSFINSIKRIFVKREYPSIAIVVCTYNEAKVIEQKIKNLLSLKYPRDKMKFYFVDAKSDDGTLEIINKYAKNDDRFKVFIQDGRKGENNAENLVMKYVNEDIVILTDAEVVLEKEALNNLISYMLNEEIGAVTGRQNILGSGITCLMEKVYRKLYYCMRKGESIIDSTFHVHGDMLAFKRMLWKPLDEYKGADDACIAFNIRRQGYKVIHADDIVFYEYAPEKVKDRYIQKVKRAAVLIESLIMNKDFIFNSRYGMFGLFIVPFNFFLMMVLPIVNLSTIILCAIQTPESPILCTFLIAILVIESYVFGLLQLLHGMIRVFITRKNRNVIWEKIDSTRKNINLQKT